MCLLEWAHNVTQGHCYRTFSHGSFEKGPLISRPECGAGAMWTLKEMTLRVSTPRSKAQDPKPKPRKDEGEMAKSGKSSLPESG